MTDRWFDISQFRHNPFAASLPVRVDGMPASFLHCITAMALNHRMYNLTARSLGKDASALLERQHGHTGSALTLIREDVSKEAVRDNQLTIISIVLFLKADVGSAIPCKL